MCVEITSFANNPCGLPKDSYFRNVLRVETIAGRTRRLSRNLKDIICSYFTKRVVCHFPQRLTHPLHSSGTNQSSEGCSCGTSKAIYIYFVYALAHVFPGRTSSKLPNLRLLLATSTQFGTFDLAAAKELGITVVSAQGIDRTGGKSSNQPLRPKIDTREETVIPPHNERGL